MATIVFGDNPGPYRQMPDAFVGSSVTVEIRDGEGATGQFTYTELETLHETVLLFTEACDALIAATIRDKGVEVPVEAIAAGDQIAVGDRIREVVTVIVRTGMFTLSTRDMLSRDTHQYILDAGDPVSRIGPSQTAACL